MALTFPLTLANLADLLPIESAPWNLVYQQEFSGLGTGEGLAHDLAPPLWEAEVPTGPMYHDDAYAAQARLNALLGSINSFYLHNPAKPGPRLDPTGSALAGPVWIFAGGVWNDAGVWLDDVPWGGTPTVGSATLHTIGANRNTVRIDSLPSGYVLSVGDFFHVDYGSPTRRALIQIVEVATASSAGLTPEFQVTPHLRPGITTGAAISLLKPAAKVKLVPGTLRLENIGGLHSRLRFTARQTLAAG